MRPHIDRVKANLQNVGNLVYTKENNTYQKNIKREIKF